MPEREKMITEKGPLKGISVVELGGGIGGAWCCKMLLEMGATVMKVEEEFEDPLRHRIEIPGVKETERLLYTWLNQNKGWIPISDLEATVANSDLLIKGEEAPGYLISAKPKRATVDLNWFGRSGPYASWRGADIAVQALCGMIFPSGSTQGPPQQLGDVQSAIVGGVTSLIAALAGLYAGRDYRHFEVSILEACMVLGELQVADSQMLNRAVPRIGVNRFSPTCPVSIHRCREGWLGITVITPAQWESFCELIEAPELARDPGLATIYLRSERVDELEKIIDTKLKSRTAAEWAEHGRRMRIPLVAVPNAEEILNHPIFKERRSLEAVKVGSTQVLAPGSPLRVNAVADNYEENAAMQGQSAKAEAPLEGLRITDFSMGWAGPLATRILSDLGAEIIKVEAGRYPDWWRATDWSPEAIARQQFEESYRFAALNRGKQSVSFDLTTSRGKELARRLVAESDAVIENHAAGVMDRLGLGWDALSAGRSDLVMASMSAFGSGNAWSDTRAYGSTLEQASGLPSFRGEDDGPPVLGHIAYGDPIGGLYGCAALLAALVHRQRVGVGQWLNLSQVECLLPFTAPALLARGVTNLEPARRGNRNVEMVPHGIFAGKGEDRWIAIAVDSESAWRSLADVLGLDVEFTEDLIELEARRTREDEIEGRISDWIKGMDVVEAARILQLAGVIAAPILKPEETMSDSHLSERLFFFDTEREHIGRQAQVALPMLIDGLRPPLRGVAPYLGGDTKDVLSRILGLGNKDYELLLEAGVVSLQPTKLRNNEARVVNVH
tara:strand:+ start:52376 stop:54730 length:2355 start_codon:yes stop_codon:yes gene_type:complete